MAKRFISTDLYDDPDFIELSPECQRFWVLMFTKCDISGVLKYSENWAARYGFKSANSLLGRMPKDWVCTLNNQKLYLPGFIEFQYGRLSENCKPHRAVIEMLKKHALWEGYLKGIHTLKDKDKDKDKNIKGGVGGNETEIAEKFSLQQVKDAAFSVGLTDELAEQFYHHYNGQGWHFGNGQPITSLVSALTRWRNNGYKFEKPEKNLTGSELAKRSLI